MGYTPAVQEALREWLREALDRDLEQHRRTPFGRAVYTRAYGDEDPVDADLDIIDTLLSDAMEARAKRDPRPVKQDVALLMEQHGLPDELRPELTEGLLQAHVQALEVARRRVLGERPTITLEGPQPAPLGSTAGEPAAPIVPATAPQPAATGPLLSTQLPAFYDHMSEVEGWRGQTLHQAKATLRMFVEVCGDKATDAYGKGDTGAFFDLARRLPALYSKDRRWRGKTLAEVAEAAKAEKVERLTMKTIRRHFAALGSLFGWLADRGKHPGPNPAHGFKFPKKAKDEGAKRIPWDDVSLVKLFSSPVWTGCHPYFRTKKGEAIVRDAKFWLPLLGLYHGNRLEEFAQLRREDIQREDGIWFFKITDEGERQLKNPQSRRRVPVHPMLLAFGFMEYVGDPAERPGELVFPELRPGGKDKKLGFYVTKWFGDYREAVGVYRRWMDYHAFRHGVTTKLFSANVNRALVDYLTGHEGEGTSQVVYNHGDQTPMKDLHDAIAKVSFPAVEAALGHLVLPERRAAA